MNNSYLNVISLIERLHRQFLEVVKLELDGMGIRDINNVQAMVLFNIGDAEMTVGELTLRGCYLGSNVSYNIKKMVEQGYLSQPRPWRARRSAHVRLSEKGKAIAGKLDRYAPAPRQHAARRGDRWRRPSGCRDDSSPARTVLEPYQRPGATVAACRWIAEINASAIAWRLRSLQRPERRRRLTPRSATSRHE